MKTYLSRAFALATLATVACATQTLTVHGSPGDRVRVVQLRDDGAQLVVAASARPGPLVVPAGYSFPGRTYRYEVEYNGSGKRACLRPRPFAPAVLWPLGFITGPLGWTSNQRVEPREVHPGDVSERGCGEPQR